MTSPVITASIDASVLDISRLMNRHNIGSVVIMDDETIAGIITERDVIRRVVAQEDDAASVNASDIMTEDVKTVNKEASVMEISGHMKEHMVRRILVVEDNSPIGIITSRDVIGLLV